ncbi:MAG: transcriptional regulator, partial [Aeromicrobium sp.]
MSPAVRPLVVESWRRSIAGGIDPERALADIRLDGTALAAIRDAHPLAAGMPVIRRLLVESAADAGLLVAVSDAAGQLLWVEGDASLRSLAEQMHFVEGADWSEASAGTNAPGTALALDRPVQIFGAEHLARQVTPWSCSAAPIHDPDTGAIL